jgi:hypothetical protein
MTEEEIDALITAIALGMEYETANVKVMKPYGDVQMYFKTKPNRGVVGLYQSGAGLWCVDEQELRSPDVRLFLKRSGIPYYLIPVELERQAWSAFLTNRVEMFVNHHNLKQETYHARSNQNRKERRQTKTGRRAGHDIPEKQSH